MRSIVVTAFAAASLIGAQALEQKAPGIMIEIPSLQGPIKPSAAEKGLVCHKDVEIGSLVKTVCRCAPASDWHKGFANGGDVYSVVDEQRSRVYYNAACR